MGEEKNGTSSNGEMAAQEESQKAPLTETSAPDEVKVEIKSEDTIEDVPQKDEEFQGLTKDELLKYSKDPFWRRLRIFLMVLFWAAWLAMLVLAILIIVQAPQCDPLPTLQWLQDSPILQIDINSFKDEAITSLMTSLGLTSFYLPTLISDRDYYQMNIQYNKERVLETLEALQLQEMNAVTDYVPTPVHRSHPWVSEPEYYNMDLMDGAYLNYSSTVLPTELKKVFEFWKTTYNVTGFLVSDSEVQENPSLVNVTTDLNTAMEGEEIVLGVSSLSMADTVNSLDIPGVFKQFVMDNYEEWHYYMFNPVGSEQQPNTPERMACVTLAMMLLPGTPLMQVNSNLTAFEATYGPIIRATMDFRSKDSIQFGETQFANTTENVLAFTRTKKGTPGYAVVINLGDGVANSTETVSFSGLSYVPESGTLAYSLDSEEPLGVKESLEEVTIGNHEGRVIQFIADY